MARKPGFRKDWSNASTGPEDPENGAGEAIRTPDPNLGKDSLSEFPAKPTGAPGNLWSSVGTVLFNSNIDLDIVWLTAAGR